MDPELLGRVFESLLATYNPETRQTARKQTGSFYTPREIVAYMVDESLLRYLAEKLEPTPPPRSNGRPGTNGTGPKLVQTQDRLAENLFKETKPQQASLSMVPAARAAVAAVPEVVDAPTEETATTTRLRSLLGHAPLVAAPHPEHAASTVAVEEEPLFSAEETRTLVRALAQAQILDPACGSGAYPMGTLQQLTNVLSRLDPYNHYWREALAEQVQLRVRGTFKIADPQERANQLADLNTVFEQHTGTDYGRKLYLIQQAMYGVDLQPIAVQIAKLRFFISLVVEQIPDDTRPNRGIRALPNLETKFVAANSLMRLARSKKDDQIKLQHLATDALKGQLLEIRRQHFLARGSEKRRLRIEDERLRNEISRLLEHDGWHPSEAKQVAAWNPYDQNAHAAFFDSEWMFGIEASGGFDIVIGNPPYIQLSRLKSQAAGLAAGKYATYEKGSNAYCLFYEMGVSNLRPNGILSFITSNSWLQTDYGRSLRRFFVQHTDPLVLINLADVQVFNTAIVETNILLLRHAPYRAALQAATVSTDYTAGFPLAEYVRQHGTRITALPEAGWTIGGDWENALKLHFDQAGQPLKKWPVKIYSGIKTGLNPAFILKNKAAYERLLNEDPKSIELLKPVLTGKDIKPYQYKYNNSWLIITHNGLRSEGLPRIDVRQDYPGVYRHLQRFMPAVEARQDQGDHWTNLRSCAYLREFEKPKIIWSKLSDLAKFTYDEQGHYLINTVLFMVGEDLKYILAVMGSKPCQWYFNQIATTTGMGTNEWINNRVEKLAVPAPTPTQKAQAETLVNQVLAAKAASATADTTALEAQIDVLVYHLYGLRYAQVKLIEPGFELSEADYARQA